MTEGRVAAVSDRDRLSYPTKGSARPGVACQTYKQKREGGKENGRKERCIFRNRSWILDNGYEYNPALPWDGLENAPPLNFLDQTFSL